MGGVGRSRKNFWLRRGSFNSELWPARLDIWETVANTCPTMNANSGAVRNTPQILRGRFPTRSSAELAPTGETKKRGGSKEGREGEAKKKERKEGVGGEKKRRRANWKPAKKGELVWQGQDTCIYRRAKRNLLGAPTASLCPLTRGYPVQWSKNARTECLRLQELKEGNHFALYLRHSARRILEAGRPIYVAWLTIS